MTTNLQSLNRIGQLIWVLLLPACMLSGCAFTQQMAQEDLLEPYYHGDSEAASEILADDYDHNLPFLLDAGMVRFNQGEFTQAYTLLNESEAEVKNDETESDVYAASKVVGEVIMNREFMNYEPRTSDTVLINMYKAYSLMGMGKIDKARVEFNRTMERQRRAVEEYKDEIRELNHEAKQQQAKKRKEREAERDDDAPELDITRITQAATSSVHDNMPQISKWSGYGDFVNPYATYLSGLFFCVNGEVASDYTKCNTMLKRVSGMAPDNPYVAHDVAMSQALVEGKATESTTKPTVWVLFENGLAPKVDEFRLDLPLFIFDSHGAVSTISFAMPILETRDEALPYIFVTNGTKLYRSELLCNFDSVMQAEYKALLPITISKAVASTATKALAQVIAQQSGGELAGLAAGLFTSIMTQADTRSWLSLPKNIQLVRVPKPKNNTLQIKAPNGTTIANILLPDSANALVHIRIPTAGSMPYINTIPFGTNYK